jgi:hypothetical protein
MNDSHYTNIWLHPARSYIRGGIFAIIDRVVVNFIPETWLIVLRLAPGAALLA